MIDLKYNFLHRCNGYKDESQITDPRRRAHENNGTDEYVGEAIAGLKTIVVEHMKMVLMSTKVKPSQASNTRPGTHLASADQRGAAMRTRAPDPR